LKIEEWKQSSPLSKFYFRPYIKKDHDIKDTDTDVAHSVLNANIDAVQKHFVGNSGVDDDDDGGELLGTTDVFTQSFLCIHQEK